MTAESVYITDAADLCKPGNPVAYAWIKGQRDDLTDEGFEANSESYNLAAFASDFLYVYKGGNGFLNSVAKKAKYNPLSAKQVRATVNVIRRALRGEPIDKPRRRVAEADPFGGSELPPPSPGTPYRADPVPEAEERVIPLPAEPRFKCFNECGFASDDMKEVIRHRTTACPKRHTPRATARPVGDRTSVPAYEPPPEARVLPPFVPKLNLDISTLPDGRYGVVMKSMSDGTTMILPNEAAEALASVPGMVATEMRLLIYVKRVKRGHSRPGKFMWTKYRRRGEWVKPGTIEVKLISGDTKELIGEQRMAPDRTELLADFVKVYMGEHEEAIQHIMADPYGAAKVYGRLTGSCGICGRTLTDPESKERGIGPDCFEARTTWRLKYDPTHLAVRSGEFSMVSPPSAPLIGRRTEPKALPFSRTITEKDRRRARRLEKEYLEADEDE